MTLPGASYGLRRGEKKRRAGISRFGNAAGVLRGSTLFSVHTQRNAGRATRQSSRAPLEVGPSGPYFTEKGTHA